MVSGFFLSKDFMHYVMLVMFTLEDEHQIFIMLM